MGLKDIELCGTVNEIVYRNESNGYTIIELHVIESNDADFFTGNSDVVTTVTGVMPGVNPGETLKVKGFWTNHSDYGLQFKAESFMVEMPASLNGMEKYLASGLLPGIGAALAKRIITEFGEAAFETIEKMPEKLVKIKGISPKKAEVIHEAFIEQREVTNVVSYFSGLGIPTGFALKIYRMYGSGSVGIIKENPYRLCDNIKGIGFKTADSVARAMGFATDGKERKLSAIRYVLNEHHEDGHTCLPFNSLIDSTLALIKSERESVIESLESLLKNGFLAEEIIDGERMIYSLSFLRAEESVALSLLSLAREREDWLDVFESERKKIEKKIGIDFSEKQLQAVEAAVKYGITIITGGPGTGKTTIIRAIVDFFIDAGIEVKLTAPTGRAAKRMSEATGREAVTIHRLLEYTVGGDEETGSSFQRDADNPIECGALIVDEVSMVDILLMNNLLKAMPENGRLILVGDVDQLASVGPGSVLKDIIDSGTIPIIRLTEIFRQSESSKIVTNAHCVNNGRRPELSNSEDSDFFFMKRNSFEQALDTILNLCQSRLVGFKGLLKEDIQVITPTKKGICGVKNLNIELQKKLNPSSHKKAEKKFGDNIFREGDKVMQTSNNYKIKWESINEASIIGEGIYNGDIGNVEAIDNEANCIYVIFDGERRVRYENENLDELELAYAMTVHKSQGSEYPAVVLPILPGPQMLMTRNLLYTALTRAKRLAVIVGTENALDEMVNNNYQGKRYSGLAARLKHYREIGY